MGDWTRRDLLHLAAAGMIAVAGARAGEPVKRRWRKAIIIGRVEAKYLQRVKNAGFDGVETTALVSLDEARQARELAERVGLHIQCVCQSWVRFERYDADEMAAAVARVERTISTAAAYGAEAVLLVPALLRNVVVPEPAELAIEVDPGSGRIFRVAADEAKYRAYVEAYNRADRAARELVARLIPSAEKNRVEIAIENVGNHLWITPTLFRDFIGSFKSHWVRAYFDIANHIQFAPSAEWVRTLGPLISRCHVKDFGLSPDRRRTWPARLREGSIDWPAVHRALTGIGFEGWLTIEDGGLSLDEFSRHLDQIIEGR